MVDQGTKRAFRLLSCWVKRENNSKAEIPRIQATPPFCLSFLISLSVISYLLSLLSSPLLVTHRSPFVARLAQAIAKLQHSGPDATHKEVAASVAVTHDPSAFYLVQ